MYYTQISLIYTVNYIIFKYINVFIIYGMIRRRSNIIDRIAVPTGGASDIRWTIAGIFVTNGADALICSRSRGDVDTGAMELNTADLPEMVLLWAVDEIVLDATNTL